MQRAAGILLAVFGAMGLIGTAMLPKASGQVMIVGGMFVIAGTLLYLAGRSNRKMLDELRQRREEPTPTATQQAAPSITAALPEAPTTYRPAPAPVHPSRFEKAKPQKAKRKGGWLGYLIVGGVALVAIAGAGRQQPRTQTATQRPASAPVVQATATERGDTRSTASRTSTAAPTATPKDATISVQVQSISMTPIGATAEEYTATGDANVRSCPQTSCEIIAGIVLGQRLTKIGQTTGATVGSSNVWYEIRLSDGRTGFVHSNFVREGTPRPGPAPTRRAATLAPGAPSPTNTALPTATAPGVNTPESFTSTPPPGSQWVCVGNLYNCSDFNRETLHSYWAACPGDPSDLDGDDNGIPCENIW